MSLSPALTPDDIDAPHLASIVEQLHGPWRDRADPENARRPFTEVRFLLDLIARTDSSLTRSAFLREAASERWSGGDSDRRRAVQTRRWSPSPPTPRTRVSRYASNVVVHVTHDSPIPPPC
jgi:hypothetical protein